MHESVFQVEETAKGAYMAQAFGHALFADAESLVELRDTVRCHFDNEVGPQAVKLHHLPA